MVLNQLVPFVVQKTLKAAALDIPIILVRLNLEWVSCLHLHDLIPTLLNDIVGVELVFPSGHFRGDLVLFHLLSASLEQVEAEVVLLSVELLFVLLMLILNLIGS